MLLYLIRGRNDLLLSKSHYLAKIAEGFMHFHYPSFLFGFVLGIFLILLLIFLLLRGSVKDDEWLFRRQKLVDDYEAEDNSPK
jgi:hypothetical protein